MTRRDRIELLLEYLTDVERGLPERDPVPQDDLLALMCKAWNHESYRMLRVLLRALWHHCPAQHVALIRRYCRFHERRVAWCRKCGMHDASQIGKIHAHPPGRAVPLQPRVVRVPYEQFDARMVADALDWLDRHWQGEAALPPAVLAIESQRKLRTAA